MRGARVLASPERLDGLRREFEGQHVIRLAGLLDDALLDQVLRSFRPADFYEREHPGVGVESCLRSDALAVQMLHMIANDARLYAVIEHITGVAGIASFLGRVFAMSQAAGHYDSWHSDAKDARLVGMSLNLSSAPVAGGEFEIRHLGSEETTIVANPTPGDAIVFRIDSEFEHRVRAVGGCATRRAYAGWFRSAADDFKRRLESSREGRVEF
jgi:hypothetical protein